MTSINPATRPRNELNEFTDIVKTLGYYWSDSECVSSERNWVRLRNGTLVRPVFKEAEDETCEDAFFAENYKYCWNLDGTSVTRQDYDMMEIIKR